MSKWIDPIIKIGVNAIVFIYLKLQKQPHRSIIKVSDIDYFDKNAMAKLRDDGIKSGIKNSDQLVKVSLEDVERVNTPNDPLKAAPKIAFGHINKAWENFKSQMNPGDELHEFSYQQNDSFGYNRHVNGYVLMRDNNPGPYFILVER